MCRIATGGGFGTRELYTNDEEIILSVQRPIIVNGIEELATRSDLLDRAIQLTLPTIDEADYTPELIFWREYEAKRPYILGAILDAVVTALHNVESIRLPVTTRMADFSQWVVAAEPSLPWTPGVFIEAYTGNRASAHELALEASPVACVLRTWIENESMGTWTGTATELLGTLEKMLPHENQKAVKPEGWPKRSNKLSGHLARLAPNLRAVGIQVTRDRDDSRSRTKSITITRTNVQSTVRNRPTVQYPASDDAGDNGSGRYTDDNPAVSDDSDLADWTHADDTDDRLHSHSGDYDFQGRREHGNTSWATEG